MSAVAWFFTSGVLFVIGAYVALFTVTTHKGLNAWVCMGFFCGAFLNVLLVLMAMLKP